MWVMTDFGFFSIVQKPGDNFLTVRARAAEDLIALRERCPELSPVEEGGGTDYPFRAKASHEALARVMYGVVTDISYSNFKNRIKQTQGADRAHIYGQVWGTLLQISNVFRQTLRPSWPKFSEGERARNGGIS